jgi:hypothetical protein
MGAASRRTYLFFFVLAFVSFRNAAANAYLAQGSICSEDSIASSGTDQ